MDQPAQCCLLDNIEIWMLDFAFKFLL